MPFLTQGKTNWKFLLIVIVLAAVVGGGVLFWQYFGAPEEQAEQTPGEIEGPYIKIISPNGGEKWITGETYTISWNTNNVGNVIISLLQGSSRSYLIGPRTGVDSSLQKFDWKIDDTAAYVGRSDLRVLLSDAAYCDYIDEATGVECVKDGLRHGDESDDYFSVTKEREIEK